MSIYMCIYVYMRRWNRMGIKFKDRERERPGLHHG